MNSPSLEDIFRLLDDMLDNPIDTVWFIHFVDEEGNRVEHTDKTFKELTFSDPQKLMDKAMYLQREGYTFEIHQLGPISYE